MQQIRSFLAPLALAALLAACAGASTTPANAPAVRTTAPRMTSRSQLELRTPGDVRIEVVVKADGRPDLRTIRITGPVDRSEVERWLTSSTFEPGRQGDVPVDAVYMTRVRMRVEVRRM